MLSNFYTTRDKVNCISALTLGKSASMDIQLKLFRQMEKFNIIFNMNIAAELNWIANIMIMLTLFIKVNLLSKASSSINSGVFYSLSTNTFRCNRIIIISFYMENLNTAFKNYFYTKCMVNSKTDLRTHYYWSLVTGWIGEIKIKCFRGTVFLLNFKLNLDT